MDKYEQAIMELSEKLDKEVYLPVKEELAGCGRTYSLGIRKEKFKMALQETIEKLRGKQ